MKKIFTLSLVAGMLINATTVLAQTRPSSPEGSTLKSKSQAKRMELFYFDDFYQRGYLSDSDIATWKKLCVDAKEENTKKLLIDFRLDNLEIEKDVRIISKMNQTMLQPGNDRSLEAYYGCRLSLQTDALNYTLVEKEFEFLNADNCEKAVEATKSWKIDNKNEVHISKRMVNLPRKERKARNLPPGTKACIVSVTGVEAL